MTEAASAGVSFFQYRNKHGSRKTIYEQSLRLAACARSNGSLFIVNDHADIARAVECDGVHLGQDDLPIADARRLLGEKRLIGISTHNRKQAVAAENAGADYIGFGPIFPTTTKDAGTVQGIASIKSVRRAVSIPIIAIGGINSGNLEAVLQAGASGAAVISAILSAREPGRAAAGMAMLFVLNTSRKNQ
jgi:thiamine-phosphate pyrophosphorylase